MSFDFAVFSVNWLAVLVAGVAYFAIGAAWYGLLAKPWMKGIGKKAEELESKATDYLFSLACETIIAFFVAVALNAFGTGGVLDSLLIGAMLWFGFGLVPTIGHYIYEGRSVSLLAINKGYDLAGILIASIILTVWT